MGRMHQMEDVMDKAAQVLSDMTNYTAVVLPPSGPQPKIRNLQLVPVSDSTALVVIVTDTSIVRDAVIPVPNVGPDTLYAISRRLTELLQGHTLAEASAMMPQIKASTDENDIVLKGVGGFLNSADTQRLRHVSVGGTSNMLSYPEYSDVEKARSFLNLMETRDRLATIMTPQDDVTFTVRIGPETGVPEMSDCSIVTCSYSTRNGRQGTIGIIGPTRMQYSRVLGILGTMGRQLSEMFGVTDGTDDSER